MTEPRTFYAVELRQSLQEHSFGIKSYEIQHASAIQAVALVHLLEDKGIEITLTCQGFSVQGEDGCHETLEGLLSVHSPLFVERRGQEWMKRLAAFADES